MSCYSPESKPDWKAYILRELNPDASYQAEIHLTHCSDCREELGTLRLTLDSLSLLREEEVPRRIAFVSDKVFEPRWWQLFLHPTFAAACLVAIAILVHGFLRPGQAQVDAAVTKAVSQVEARHTKEMQVMFEQLDLQDKQIRNFYLSNAAIYR